MKNGQANTLANGTQLRLYGLTGGRGGKDLSVWDGTRMETRKVSKK